VTPLFAVDVGAYKGTWTREFKKLFPECAVLMIEPQRDLAPELTAVCDELPDVAWMDALLGRDSGTPVTFEVMKSGSSVYSEQSPYPRTPTVRETWRLDDNLTRFSQPVDYLKLDVQGYELEVLAGCPKALAQAKVVAMEASLIPTNKGAPLFMDVMRYMDERGFRLTDIDGLTRRKDGMLWQADLAFAREDSDLLPDVALTTENWGVEPRHI